MDAHLDDVNLHTVFLFLWWIVANYAKPFGHYYEASALRVRRVASTHAVSFRDRDAGTDENSYRYGIPMVPTVVQIVLVC